MLENAQDAVRRYRTQTLAQRASHHLAIPLEEHIAFLKSGEIDTAGLLKRLAIPDRPGALVSPRLPPYFGSVDRDRQVRMIEAAVQPGPLQTRITTGWIPLFTPPPPPTYVPREKFVAGIQAAIEKRFRDTASTVEKLRARGSKIVFVRFPVTGELKALEDRATPRSREWDRLLRETAAPGIYFEDFPELSSFNCPEESHLSAPDAVEFTRRLLPHLRTALGL